MQGGGLLLLELLVVLRLELELLVELLVLLDAMVLVPPSLVALEPVVVPEAPQHPTTFAPLTNMMQAVCAPVQNVALPIEIDWVLTPCDETSLLGLFVDPP